jgi:FkbM family methyltransferase
MTSMLGSVRACIRRLLRELGYDIHKIQVGRDPFHDMHRVIGRGRPPVIFDVGANVGQTIESFLQVLTQANIHAFEPGQETFRKLCEKYSGVPNLVLNNVALGAVAGTAEFIENTAPTMSSFLEPGAETWWGEVKQRVQARVKTVDEYCDEHRIDYIDILKLDTQGFDLEVMRGAGRLLSAQRIHLIYVEIIFSEMYRGLPRLDHIFGFLADRGFVPVAFYDFNYQNERVSWADALFVNPQFRPNESSDAAPLVRSI